MRLVSWTGRVEVVSVHGFTTRGNPLDGDTRQVLADVSVSIDGGVPVREEWFADELRVVAGGRVL